MCGLILLASAMTFLLVPEITTRHSFGSSATRPSMDPDREPMVAIRQRKTMRSCAAARGGLLEQIVLCRRCNGLCRGRGGERHSRKSTKHICALGRTRLALPLHHFGGAVRSRKRKRSGCTHRRGAPL